MSARAGNWLIVCGGLVMFVALSFLPAMLRDRSDTSLIGAGAILFCFGLLLISTGIYLKAKLLGGTSRSPESPTPARRSRGACDLCRGEAPVIQCKVHQLHLCPACLAEHYDFRSCAYVPSTRTRASRGAARAHGA
jgi:hypothetical protein